MSFTAHEARYLSRKRTTWLDRLSRPSQTTDFDRILFIIFLCLAGYVCSLIVDLFIVREPVHAQEIPVVEEFDGQTRELCGKLANI